jgi:N-acetyl-gamma-glutamyl-phosphate reductase
MKAAILGTTGYTGMVLLRILSRHPEITDIIPASSSQAGTGLTEFDPGLSRLIGEKTRTVSGRLVSVEDALAAKPDVVFAALPHLTSAEVCGPFFTGSVVVDLSADFRIKDPAVFEKAYGERPHRPDLLEKAVYGLAEWNTDSIKKADLIANPGCYPTATLLPLLPLAKAGMISGAAVANALSGISGAGRSAKINNLFCERSENTNAYSPGKLHRHASEIQQLLNLVPGGLDILFTPHLVPLKQGMAVTTVTETTRPLSDGDIAAVYEESYGGRPFIEIRGRGIPETRDVRNSNRCDIGWHREGGRLILFSVIDNLIKGASGQAVQNMNLRFGFAEAAGLAIHGEI